jgi:hypothetical protein
VWVGEVQAGGTKEKVYFIFKVIIQAWQLAHFHFFSMWFSSQTGQTKKS